MGFPAGTATDIAARLIGRWLSEHLGQPFVIENLPGASSNLATEKVVKAVPDGYTLLEISSANAQNASAYNNLNFNFIRDIAPVAGIYRAPVVMVITPSLPVKTVPEFISYAKANPGKINMASVGVGSLQHLAGEMFKSMAGIVMLHVPYRVNPLPDLLGGQVQVMFSPIAGAIEYVSADERSQLTYLRVREILSRWNERIVEKRLEKEHKTTEYVDAVRSSATDLSTKGRQYLTSPASRGRGSKRSCRAFCSRRSGRPLHAGVDRNLDAEFTAPDCAPSPASRGRGSKR